MSRGTAPIAAASSWPQFVSCLIAGAVSVASFAPLDLFPLPFLTLALLVWCWHRAASPRAAAAMGFLFGFGLFLAGVSWIYVSLHFYGGMPVLLAAFATLLFCAVLALFPAFGGWLYARLCRRVWWQDALIAAAAWTLSEWARGWVMSGFPWLSMGYSQSPPSPLSGYAAVAGVYGIGFLVVLIAALLTAYWRMPHSRRGGAVVMLLLVVVGYGLSRIAWTSPREAEVSVSLIQPNIPQSLKWQPELLGRWLRENLELVERHPAQLIVLPETTLPLAVDDLPAEYLERMTLAARAAKGDVIFGAFTRRADVSGTRYFNSAISLGSDPSQRYSKQHLVAFGEFSPPGLAWVYRWLSIPMSDQSPGPAHQAPLALAGERVALNICYEDVFGEEIVRALPEATLLLNLSNTAWFGRSLMQPQHLQISRMRALETGRPMLRATNTGMTAVIDPHGEVTQFAPPFETSVITAKVRGYTGMTPYAYIGNTLAVGVAALVLLAAYVRKRRRWLEPAQ